MSKKLDQIIRTIMMEQIRPISVLEPDRLDSKGENFIKTQLCPIIGVKPGLVSRMYEIYGFYINIKERGGFPKIPGAEIVTPEQNENELFESVLEYINGSKLSGVWGKNRTPDWYWFITRDLNITKRDIPMIDKDKNPGTPNVPNKNFKPKQERFIAKYKYQCIYVKTDLIPTSMRSKISSSTSGYIRTLTKGAMVFDIEKLQSTDWIPKQKTGSGGVDPTDPMYGQTNIPYTELTFGSTDILVKQLSRVLNMQFFTDQPYSIETNLAKFGCAHRELLKAYQKQNGLAITGEYDKATRQNFQVVKDQYAQKNKEYDGVQWNTMLNTDQLQQLVANIQACQIENRESSIPTDQITVPEGGFKAGVTVDDVNFYAVQKLMLSAIEKVGGSKTETYKNLKTALDNETKRGDYWKDPKNNGATQLAVKFLKHPSIAVKFPNLAYPDQDSNVVKSDFVKILQNFVK